MPPDTALFALACLVSIAGLAPALIAFVRTFHRPRGVQVVRVPLYTRSLKRVSGYRGEA